MSVLDSFQRVQAEVEAVVDKVDRGRLGEPTPCDEWDVGALLSHLIHINQAYAAIADRLKAPNADAANLGDDYRSTFRESGRLAGAAFSRPGMLEEAYAAPWGEIPGSDLVQHVVNELLVHGWDLAKATGQSTDLAPDLAEESLMVWRGWIGELPRGGMLPIGPEQPAPANATAADRLAAYLGRAV